MITASFAVLDNILLGDLMVSQDPQDLSILNKSNSATTINYHMQSTLTSVDGRIATIAIFNK